MAEEDAEMALLRAMQTSTGAGGLNGGEQDAANGEPDTESNEQEKKIVADDQVLRELPTVTISGQDDSRSSSRASRKTIGGFLPDSDDEEDDADPTTGTPSAANTPNRVVAAPSPLHNSITQADLKTENQDIPAMDASKTLSVTPSVQAPPVPNSAAPLVSVPKARLPHDKVGKMEDQIKEDPRGSIEAWLSLITEHRNRNKIEEARAVYDRFFRVFPDAVSSTFTLWGYF